MSDERRQPKRKRSDSLPSTPPPSAKREATDERHFTNAPLDAEGGQTSYLKGKQSGATLSPTASNTPASSTGETRQSHTSVIPSISPRNRLDYMYGLHPFGQELGRTAANTSSGVLNVKSSEDMDKYKAYLNKSQTDQKAALNDKTTGDLHKLKYLGFEIKFSNAGILGSGVHGKVYRGVYGDGISAVVKTPAGRHMKGVKVGQPFAAKYVQFPPTAEDVHRLYHETEKQIMKHIKHQNIVDIKVAINLGKKRYLLHKRDPQIKPIVSYDRMFLIMDLAVGSLNDFCTGSKLTNELAIDFTRDMCAGMCYLHDMGVVHYDAHAGNVLIFDTPTGQVAKWADFGLSVWRQKNEEWGLTIHDNEFMQLIHTEDFFDLAETIELMADTVPTGPESVNDNLHKLASDLSKSGKTLAEVLQNYERFRRPRDL